MTDKPDGDFDQKEFSANEMLEALIATTSATAHIERSLTLSWLRREAARFLFAEGLDDKLREYGTTVLEMVADAIEAQEHVTAAGFTQETVQ